MKTAQPEVVQIRTPEHPAANGGIASAAPIDRIASGLSNINHVNKGSSVGISQNGLYGYTDLPPKDFIGHVSGE